jgi:hypothetical protein
MQKQDLETEVARTASEVEKWQGVITGITRQFEIANVALMRAKKAREAHALKAAQNETAAVAAIAAARSDLLAAEQTINDLEIALPAAEAQLAIAQKAATSARHELAMLHVGVLIRRRIDVAGQIGAVVADVARLYGEYEKLGREIINMPDATVVLPNMHGISNFEGVLGARRVRASLPAFFWKLFPGAIHDEMKTENLATSEARFWNLPPEQEKTKAA